MKRITIYENSKIVPEYADVFDKYARREGEQLRQDLERMFAEEPDAWLLAKEELEHVIAQTTPEEYWLEEGKRGVIAACNRLGCGSISLTQEEIDVLLEK